MGHLGRLYSPDARDAGYPMSLVQPAKAESIFRLWRYWRELPALDQGQTPQCVGFSWKQWLRTAPLMTQTGVGPSEIYDMAQRVDEWKGTPHAGTSVRAAAQVMNGLGYIANYLWASSPEELTTWVLTKGPVIVGTNWTQGMFDPDRGGTVHPTGPIAGGHAYLITGANKITKKYRLLNSWGTGWGKAGNFWMKMDDLHALIFDQQGEACAAIEQPVNKP